MRNKAVWALSIYFVIGSRRTASNYVGVFFVLQVFCALVEVISGRAHLRYVRGMCILAVVHVSLSMPDKMRVPPGYKAR